MDRADRHTRLVLWLKIALPLLALAILSTLFFVAETLDPDAAIPYAEVDVDRILREQGMTQPVFGGVTTDGVQIALSASAVRPVQDTDGQLIGTTLHAQLDLPDRGTITIQSPDGVIDTASGQAILQGGTVLQSSTGYTVETDRIVTSYAQATAETDSEVRATGPAGTLTAGRMSLARRPGDDAGYLLVFKDGVELIYEPQP
ncbi:MAG: LPS export ABC transporter periplasmic protein LptC [Silicimonas sp.]|nr:LPS export ABC transporter periplasmic protein LptC [Silicimonas sp.]